MTETAKAQWADIAIESLSDESQVAYAEYKDVQRKAAALRAAFEQSVIDSLDAPLPQGKRMAFGYKFGKLSAAIVDDDRKAKKATQTKGSLADFMAQQLGNGHAL